MSDKCPANYKNLNSIQSFSEQKYATIQWANQNCENDEYLKKEVDTLGYLTPPAVRKRFSPILLDETQSWGCMIQKGNRNDKNIVCFNTKDTDEILIDFTDFSLIDTDKSDCIFETIPEKTNGVITGSKKRAAVPFVQTSTVDYNCRTYQNGDGINSYWYVGFDKAKSYQVRPDWIKDYFDEEIPAIVRAQTFTIPSGISNGKL